MSFMLGGCAAVARFEGRGKTLAREGRQRRGPSALEAADGTIAVTEYAAFSGGIKNHANQSSGGERRGPRLSFHSAGDLPSAFREWLLFLNMGDGRTNQQLPCARPIRLTCQRTHLSDAIVSYDLHDQVRSVHPHRDHADWRRSEDPPAAGTYTTSAWGDNALSRGRWFVGRGTSRCSSSESSAEADLVILGPLMKPYDAGELEAFPVSTFVNSPKHDGPECVEPLANTP